MIILNVKISSDYGKMKNPPFITAEKTAKDKVYRKKIVDGISKLGQHIPDRVVSVLTKGDFGSAKELSKANTVKMALYYIKGMIEILDDAQISTSASSSNGYSKRSQLLQSILQSEASLLPTLSYSSDKRNYIQTNQKPFDAYVINLTTSVLPEPSNQSDIPIHHYDNEMYTATSDPFRPAQQFDNSLLASTEYDDLLEAITQLQQLTN